MFQVPNYTETVSMKLSEVLSDIGVNERSVLNRRRLTLHEETILNNRNKILYKGLTTCYILGSQSEGTTTLGLNSDQDVLLCSNIINVIQDWSDWRPGVQTYLMIQDDSVSPGYCKLQALRLDAPLPSNEIFWPFMCKDRNGRVLLKSSTLPLLALFTYKKILKLSVERNGPAITVQAGDFNFDSVIAIPCATWPLQARQWLDQESVGQWPSDQLKRYCCSIGCFAVHVGRTGSGNEDLEWRISTSLAEQCLMFSLNITQIRCYVLMKMIKKTFIDPLFNDVISSYMCKTVLFHCIENNPPNIWRQNNLLECLSICIYSLYINIRDECCPHFIITGNNLMRGKIPPEAKPHILVILKNIIESEVSALLRITCDDLGTRLQLMINLFCPFKICVTISRKLQYFYFLLIQIGNELFMYAQNDPMEVIRRLKQNISNILSTECHNELEKKAHYLVAVLLGAKLGSVLASRSIQQRNNISAEALTWINLCLRTDVASSKLKLASMLYCTRQYQRTELVLRNIEQNYDTNILEPFCWCHAYASSKQAQRPGFNAVNDAIQSVKAFCVKFSQCEIHFVPEELRQEMFRSTNEDKAFREPAEFWMNLAVVDSLIFLYFLQYKLYHDLGRQEQKHRALNNLSRAIEQEPNISHRETALNILGQCMEQEQQPRHALQCYSLSLNIRNRNNAAKIHICRLLNHLFHNQQ